MEADFNFNVICITDEHSLYMALCEGLPTVSLKIVMNCMRFTDGTVGTFMTLNYKSTHLEPRCILSAPRLYILDISAI